MINLCRVTVNGYFIDEDGYLLTHGVMYEYAMGKFRTPPKDPRPIVLNRDRRVWLPRINSHNHRRVSLVSTSEWETVARFLSVTKPTNGDFRLLTIDISKIEELENEAHPALMYGEFYGRVPKEAVLKDEGYRWVRGSREIHVLEVGREFIKQRLPLDHEERLTEYGLEKI